jgi:acetylornithine deacetylase/succinyl-diaminopimelate desuccinylase-like protein
MTSSNEPVKLLTDFLRIDTSNPPGNEEEAVQFLERVLKGAGIASETFVPAPKRANLLARIKGKKRGKPLILLSHVDVVPASAEEWIVPPFSGEIREGFIFGRGAIDMKSQAICQLLSFIAIHKEGVVPERDMVFLATCDEEVGGRYGMEYMLGQVDELKGASFVLSEGGSIKEDGGHLHAQVSVAEKRLSQFMIKARGTGGHGSMPHRDNANEKIIDAAKAILSYEWPLRPTNIVSRYLDGALQRAKGKGFAFTTLGEALRNRYFRDFIMRNPEHNAILRNTVTLTILKGGEKVNVIPSESSACFDARLLPGADPGVFFKKIEKLCGKDIEVTPISDGGKGPAAPSGYNTPYFKGIQRIIRSMKGPIPVLPFLTTGATDMRFFRNLGIPAYGFFPISLSNDELFRMHGINERISIRNLQEGAEGTYRIVKFLASVP